MMNRRPTKMVLFGLGLALVQLMSSRIAFAADEAPKTSISTNSVSSASATTPTTLIADGQAIDLQKLNAKITPPQGWEVKLGTGGFSIVMQEMRKDPKPGDKVIFQRNITLAAIQRPAPIDEVRAQELEAELTKAVMSDGSASNFKVLEHKFFNFKGENDGLMLYSTVKLGEFEMMQMHVLVGNDERQFLSTYTDFADQFSKTSPAFEAAWKSMTSLQFDGGAAPQRYESLVRNGSVAAVLGLLFVVMNIIRSRRAKTDYEHEADEIYRDEGPYVTSEGKSNERFQATVTGMWNLAARRQAEGTAEESDDMWLTDDAVGIAKS